MHFYKFNIGDYKSHTSHLDLLEDLAYRRMLDYCYLNETGLPESADEIARLISMRTHSESIANVLREFFVLENGEYINERAAAEIFEYKEKNKKAAKSAKARWRKNKEKADANALRTECEGNAKQETLNKKQETLIKSAVASLPCTKGETYHIQQSDVDTWSNAYPAVDILQELRKIYAWLSANPSKLKTLKGCPRFVNNWFSRTQDQGGNKKVNTNKTVTLTQKQDFIELHTDCSWANDL